MRKTVNPVTKIAEEIPELVSDGKSLIMHVFNFSRSTSSVTSISVNKMSIRNPLCNVRHLNGMLNISLEIFLKKTH